MVSFLDWLNEAGLRGQLVASIGLVLVAIVLRTLLWRALRSATRMSTKDRLRWGVTSRNAALALTAIGLTAIWGSEIQGFAATLVVLAAAFALAFKELFMCVSGSVVRTVGRSFDVGDRVEIRGVRGDVIDANLLSTTLLEIGPGFQRTGRAITLPNSMLLTEQVVNETFSQAYILHVVRLPTTRESWAEDEARALTIANEVSKPVTEEARAQMDAVSRRHGLSPFSVSPRVAVQHESATSVSLLLRVPTKARDKSRTEQLIVRRFLGVDEDLNEPSRETLF